MTIGRVEMESLLGRPLPGWYADAKFGVFVHWTAASVPAYAPVVADPFALAREHGWAHALASSPYVEWYQNSLAIPGSPVERHHRQRYGDLPYAAFVEAFLAGIAAWDPDGWADLFAAAGARYVVLVTKHHDGVLLWPSTTPNPHRPAWRSERDVVGELAAAVRARGLRFGVYYSGGLDWTFGGLPIDSFEAMLAAIPADDGYRAYCEAHWDELVERYEPSVLWDDIASPPGLDLASLFSRYYDAVPDGVVNDRFDLVGAHRGTVHADVVTPEYSSGPPPARPFEVCRGIGTSFGFNRAATEADHLSAEELVRLLVDVVAGGGNLLLNVGPAADGAVPAVQADRLLAMGWWLRTNGPALYGCRPWAAGASVPSTADGRDVRWTVGGDGGQVFAVVLGPGDEPELTLPGLSLGPETTVELLGRRGAVPWSVDDAGLRVDLGTAPPPGPAVTLAFSPAERVRIARVPQARTG